MSTALSHAKLSYVRTLRSPSVWLLLTGAALLAAWYVLMSAESAARFADDPNWAHSPAARNPWHNLWWLPALLVGWPCVAVAIVRWAFVAERAAARVGAWLALLVWLFAGGGMVLISLLSGPIEIPV